MKLRFFFIIGFSLLVIIPDALEAGSSEQRAAFEQAIVVEEIHGRIEEAIVLYQKIVEDAEEQSLAAQAQLRIGVCYEKLGLKEAREAYQTVIDNYPGEQREVAIARKKLARLAQLLADVTKKPHFRKLKIPTKLSWDGQISPDGEKYAYGSDGALWLMPLSSHLGLQVPGAPVKLDTGSVRVSRWGPTWSRDGKWLAFNYDDENPDKDRDSKLMTCAMYVVAAQGGKPRKVFENFRGQRTVNYRLSLSRNGKTLAFSAIDEKRNVYIHSTSVDGGEPKQLVQTPAREPAFSPDGKLIAYVEGHGPTPFPRERRGLWVIPADDGTPRLITDTPKNAGSPLWSPDGDMIAFLDRGADESKEIWIIPVSPDGRPTGEPTKVDLPGGVTGARFLVGWTPDNRIGVTFQGALEFALYTVPSEGGKAAVVTEGGYPVQPRWSPDGSRIFHTNVAGVNKGAWERLGITSVPFKGGEVTTVPVESDAKIYKPAWGGGNRISPDGKTIVFSGIMKGSSGPQVWTLPVDGGPPRQLTSGEARIVSQFPCWSPDGESIAFVRARRSKDETPPFYQDTAIYIVPAEGGEAKRLTSESDQVNFSSIGWSPDGGELAYFSQDYDATEWDGKLKVVLAETGESQVICQVENFHVNIELAWSPDSTRIAFNDAKESLIRVVSIDGGNPVNIETDLVDVNTYHLDWSPDGKTFAFCGYKGGDPELWLMEDFLHLVKRSK